MAVIFSGKVFEGGISGTTAVYTPPDLYSRIAQGEKFFVQVRATQTSGTSPTLAVLLEHSCEGVAALSWTTKATMIAATAIPTAAATYLVGSDLGTAVPVGGSYMRLAMTLGGTSPGAFVEVWLTVRSND